jgi:outer membrane protein
MKNFVSFLSILSLCFLFQTSSAFGQQFKVASVDMSKVFSEYYKTKKAEAELKDRASACEKELRDQETALKKLSDDVTKLKEDAENPAFTDDKKAETRRLIDSKVSDGRIKAQQLQDMVASRRKELDDQRNRVRVVLVDEIMKTVQEKAKKEGYSMVVDKTGLTSSGISPFLYIQDSLDITSDVIKQINANAPATATSTSPKDTKK